MHLIETLIKSIYLCLKKYGIDSLEAVNKIDLWVRSREKVLMDSITTLFIRDQKENVLDVNISARNDLKNAKLMKWIFDNYGYPSLQKWVFWE